MISIEISSYAGGGLLRDAASRYLMRAVGAWGITDPARLESGLEGIGIAADVAVGEDGTVHAVVLPLHVAEVDEAA